MSDEFLEIHDTLASIIAQIESVQAAIKAMEKKQKKQLTEALKAHQTQVRELERATRKQLQEFELQDRRQSAEQLKEEKKLEKVERAIAKAGHLTHEQKILVSLSHAHPFAVKRDEVCYYAGISNISSTTSNALKNLIDDGVIVSERGYYQLKSDTWGEYELENRPGIASKAQIFEAACSRLGGSPEKLLRALVSQHRSGQLTSSKSQIVAMAKVSANSSTTHNAFKKLSDLGYVEGDGRGQCRLSDWMARATAIEIGVFDGATGKTHKLDPNTGKVQ